MVILKNTSASGFRPSRLRSGTCCLLAGVLTACGGGGGDTASLPTSTAARITAVTADGVKVKSVAKNDPLVHSENRATVKLAENKCRRHTQIKGGDSTVRKSQREDLRKEECSERG